MAGVARVIVGTAALRQPEMIEEACGRYPGRIALGLDARDGYVAVEGWKESTQTDAVTLVLRFKNLELAAVIYTDIHRDGMQTGVNVEATRRLMERDRGARHRFRRSFDHGRYRKASSTRSAWTARSNNRSGNLRRDA